jgi:UDPglucose 6-dehydrogenase
MSEEVSATPSVAVAGLWHLGTVIAACLASRGISTLGYDPDPEVVAGLAAGRPPIFEPGLEDLVRDGLKNGTLRVSSHRAALAEAEIVWVAWDTPVDDEDRADVEFVIAQVTALFPHLKDDALVLVSSQLPVGSVKRLEQAYAALKPSGHASFACSPENLRLGKAIEAFTKPDRVVLGVRSGRDADRVRQLLAPFSPPIDVVRVESAEMTKHALNAFLATSVAFINEVARLGEVVGADAREVERALKSDVRIGPRAYVRAGGAYAGGTLARDVSYLIEQGEARGREMPLFRGVRESNDLHRGWAYDVLVRCLGQLSGHSIAVLGLTYKPGTDTLRRSPAVDLCQRLVATGAHVIAYDPAVKTLPPDLATQIDLASTAHAALQGASAAVIATEWPEFRTLTTEAFVGGRQQAVVVDPGGFLAGTLQADSRIRYTVVGTPA